MPKHQFVLKALLAVAARACAQRRGKSAQEQETRRPRNAAVPSPSPPDTDMRGHAHLLAAHLLATSSPVLGTLASALTSPVLMCKAQLSVYTALRGCPRPLGSQLCTL